MLLKKMLRKLNHKISKKALPLSAAAMALLISGCGGHPYSEVTSLPGTSTGGSGSGGTTVTGTVSVPVPTPSPTVDPNLAPAYQYSFQEAGSNAYSVSVSTDNVLKVRVTAGPGAPVSGTNFTAAYSCIRYQVSAIGQTVTTPALAVNGGGQECPGAPSSYDIDFSSRLSPGHGPVTVTVNATGYDFYCTNCLSQPWLYNAYPYGSFSCSYYCPLYGVYQNHQITGNLTIGVSGTNF